MLKLIVINSKAVKKVPCVVFCSIPSEEVF